MFANLTTTITILMTTAAPALSLIAVLGLIALLVLKELIRGLRGERIQRLRSALNIAIVPLAMVYIITIGFKLANILL
jgi:hypothetical protein